MDSGAIPPHVHHYVCKSDNQIIIASFWFAFPLTVSEAKHYSYLYWLIVISSSENYLSHLLLVRMTTPQATEYLTWKRLKQHTVIEKSHICWSVGSEHQWLNCYGQMSCDFLWDTLMVMDCCGPPGSGPTLDTAHFTGRMERGRDSPLHPSLLIFPKASESTSCLTVHHWTHTHIIPARQAASVAAWRFSASASGVGFPSREKSSPRVLCTRSYCRLVTFLSICMSLTG